MKRVRLGRRRNKLPSICVDEHVSPEVASVFKRIFRTIEASRWRKVKGRDERDYFRQLFAANTVFVTSDIEFSRYISDKRIKHAGVVYLPNRLEPGEKLTFAEIAAVFIRGGCRRNSSRAFNRCILYPAHDGVRLVRPRQGDELALSWAELREDD